MNRSEAHLTAKERHGRAIGRPLRDHDVYVPRGVLFVEGVAVIASATLVGLVALWALTACGLLL